MWSRLVLLSLSLTLITWDLSAAQECGQYICGHLASCVPGVNICNCDFSNETNLWELVTEDNVTYCMRLCYNDDTVECEDNTTCTSVAGNVTYRCDCRPGFTRSSSGQCLADLSTTMEMLSTSSTQPVTTPTIELLTSPLTATSLRTPTTVQPAPNVSPTTLTANQPTTTPMLPASTNIQPSPTTGGPTPTTSLSTHTTANTTNQPVTTVTSTTNPVVSSPSPENNAPTATWRGSTPSQSDSPTSPPSSDTSPSSPTLDNTSATTQSSSSTSRFTVSTPAPLTNSTSSGASVSAVSSVTLSVKPPTTITKTTTTSTSRSTTSSATRPTSVSTIAAQLATTTTKTITASTSRPTTSLANTLRTSTISNIGGNGSHASLADDSGFIIGVAVGCTAALVLIFVIVFVIRWFRSKQRSRRRRNSHIFGGSHLSNPKAKGSALNVSREKLADSRAKSAVSRSRSFGFEAGRPALKNSGNLNKSKAYLGQTEYAEKRKDTRMRSQENAAPKREAVDNFFFAGLSDVGKVAKDSTREQESASYTHPNVAQFQQKGERKTAVDPQPAVDEVEELYSNRQVIESKRRARESRDALRAPDRVNIHHGNVSAGNQPVDKRKMIPADKNYHRRQLSPEQDGGLKNHPRQMPPDIARGRADKNYRSRQLSPDIQSGNTHHPRPITPGIVGSRGDRNYRPRQISPDIDSGHVYNTRPIIPDTPRDRGRENRARQMIPEISITNNDIVRSSPEISTRGFTPQIVGGRNENYETNQASKSSGDNSRTRQMPSETGSGRYDNHRASPDISPEQRSVQSVIYDNSSARPQIPYGDFTNWVINKRHDSSIRRSQGSSRPQSTASDTDTVFINPFNW